MVTSLAPNVTTYELESGLGKVSIQSIRDLGWKGAIVDRLELARSLPKTSPAQDAADQISTEAASEGRRQGHSMAEPERR